MKRIIMLNDRQKEPRRRGVIFRSVTIAAVLIGAAFVLKSLRRLPETATSAPATSAAELKTAPVPAPPPVQVKFSSETLKPAQTVESDAAQQAPRSARQLMSELVELCGTGATITKAQAEKFKQNLQELIQQGATSVPAIQEFLAKNLDIDFAEVRGGDQLSYSSLRASLLDALKQIGGPEARTAMLDTLQNTALPVEILELAKDLEGEAPGQYRDQILNAAQEAFNMANANQLGSNVEVGPLFRVFEAYAGADMVADPAKNDPLTFYDALTMANLPDGQGLPSLVRLAENSSSGSQTIAAEMIAQLASQNTQALETLVQMTKNGQIPNSSWLKLAPILGGAEYQFGDAATPNGASANEGNAGASGELSYAVVNAATTPEQLNQRIAMIDKFLDVLPGDSSAAAALKRERGVLNGRLGN